MYPNKNNNNNKKKRKEKDKKKIKVRKEGTDGGRQRDVRESDFRERSSSFSLRFMEIGP